MATHPTFYVGRLTRYHDPLGLPSQTEGGQGENSPPRNEAESSGQPELPVLEPVTDTLAGTHASHTKDMMVPSGKNLASTEFLQGGSRNSAVNTPMEPMSLTTKSVQISTKDLKGPRLASLRGSLTTRSKPKGYLDLEADGPRRLTKTPQSPDPKLRVQKKRLRRSLVLKRVRELLLPSLTGTASSTTMWSGSSKSDGTLGSASC
ncbi:hypothetical protein PHPALM_27965 [Phytophthora palmivora]|uniref:Pol protein n=1 Tax=Phytophthora palmivora TaxID=4796 RepID=A0A2P4XB99_9STRA|nr:hypothetical protein PHPALM_27965 [Phytophthora palmivora]